MTIRACYYEAWGEFTTVSVYDDDEDPAVIEEPVPDGGGWLEDDTATPENQYVIAGSVVKDRPSLYDSSSVALVPDGKDTIRFALPPGTKVYSDYDGAVMRGASPFGKAIGRRIGGRVTRVPSFRSEFELSTRLAGEFTFDFEPPFPFKPLTLTIKAGV